MDSFLYGLQMDFCALRITHQVQSNPWFLFHSEDKLEVQFCSNAANNFSTGILRLVNTANCGAIKLLHTHEGVLIL